MPAKKSRQAGAQKRSKERINGYKETIQKHRQTEEYLKQRYATMPEEQRIHIWNKMTALEEKLYEKFRLEFPFSAREGVGRRKPKSRGEHARLVTQERQKRLDALKAISNLTFHKQVLFGFLPPELKSKIETEHIAKMAEGIVSMQALREQRDRSREQRRYKSSSREED